MKKIIVTALLLSFFSVFLTRSTFAYGGANLPPGTPPPVKIKLVCKYENKIIKIFANKNKIVKIPRCEIVIIKNNNFNERISSFINEAQENY